MVATRIWIPAPPKPTVAVFGDSICEQNSSNTAALRQYNNHGFMTWLNILSGQRFNFPLANNFGVGGETLTQIAARVSTVVTAAPDVCFIVGGTNSLTASHTYDTMKADMVSILVAMKNAGILPVVFTIMPRAAPTALTTGQAQIAMRFNTWLRELGWGRSDLMADAGLRYPPIVIDMTQKFADPTSTTFGALSGYLLDGLHPGTNGAYWMGKTLLAALSPIYPPRPTNAVTAADVYNASALPTGSLNSNPHLAGSATSFAASNGITATGNIATGWTGRRTVGASSTTTLVFAKENPRTDLGVGDRQQATVAISGTGGLTTEQYGMLQSVTANASVGDTVFGEQSVEVKAVGTNMIAPNLNIQELGPASSPSVGACAWSNTANQQTPSEPWSGVLRTPPLLLESGMTNLLVTTTMVFYGVPNTGGGSWFFGDVVARKVLT